jgi:hypothetical protein
MLLALQSTEETDMNSIMAYYGTDNSEDEAKPCVVEDDPFITVRDRNGAITAEQDSFLVLYSAPPASWVKELKSKGWAVYYAPNC